MIAYCRGCLLQLGSAGIDRFGFRFCSASCACAYETGHVVGLAAGRDQGALAARRTCAETTFCELCIAALRLAQP